VSKRARYDGPYTEVVVHWPPGETAETEDKQSWTVKQGGLLPAEAPAKLRDELTASEFWSEVDQSSGSQKGA
jgi:hypothetical protein